MQREKGIAYCGLACCLCGENATCAGCRNGGCQDKEWCKNSKCCREKGLAGCWQCSEFPCQGGMLDKMRIRAFARFIQQYGEEKLMDCLDRNERAGVVYHYPGAIIGDYDIPLSEAAVIEMILNGK